MISSVHILGDNSAHLKNSGYNAAQLPLTKVKRRAYLEAVIDGRFRVNLNGGGSEFISR
jgi:hypothetical protein